MCWYCERGGIIRQHKFCQDKQQYNNAKPFPIYVVEIEEVEDYCMSRNFG